MVLFNSAADQKEREKEIVKEKEAVKAKDETLKVYQKGLYFNYYSIAFYCLHPDLNKVKVQGL